MDNDEVVRIPEPMWKVMEPILRAELATISNEFQRKGFEQYGVRTSLRLRDGVIKGDVRIAWDGRVVEERLEELGVRAEAYGPPRFTSDDIESWGYCQLLRAATLVHPFRKTRKWKARVRADGHRE
jgi:hypothetical protein